jgi:hypothetical protein
LLIQTLILLSYHDAASMPLSERGNYDISSAAVTGASGLPDQRARPGRDIAPRDKENLDPGAQMNLSGSPDRFSNRTSGKNRLSLGVVTVGSNTEVPARGLVANGNPRSQVAGSFGARRKNQSRG